MMRYNVGSELTTTIHRIHEAERQYKFLEDLYIEQLRKLPPQFERDIEGVSLREFLKIRENYISRIKPSVAELATSHYERHVRAAEETCKKIMDDKHLKVYEVLLNLPDGEYTVNRGKIYPHICINCFNNRSLLTFVCDEHHENDWGEIRDQDDMHCDDFMFNPEQEMK